jgi:serine/threonine protein phosphatase 1
MMLPGFQIASYAINKKGRDLAVGDIHGCFSRVRAALRAIDFNEAVDRLFCVGDLVDRGAQSDRVLEWLERPWVRSVMGNHEQMLLGAVKGDAFDRRFHNLNGGDWLELLPADEQVAIAERVSQLPLVVEVETPQGVVGLIHSDSFYDDWSEIREMEQKILDDDHPFVWSCLWAPLRFKRQYRQVVNGIRAVVHGHVTVPDVTVLGNTFYIDTGGWLPSGQGHFTLLNLHTLMPELPPDATRGPGVRRN